MGVITEIEGWWVGFALLGVWIGFGLILHIIMRDRRRTKERRRAEEAQRDREE
jgi:TRAP-type C4-dicarboxylate transport system permease small subunit